MRMSLILLSSVACLAVTYFPTLSHKRRDFREEKFIKHKICGLIISTNFVWNIPHSKKNAARYYHKSTSIFMYNIRYSYRILIKRKFCRLVFVNLQMSNLMKIRPLGTELFHVERATYIHTYIETDRQIDRHTYIHKYIHTYRQTYIHTYIHT